MKNKIKVGDIFHIYHPELQEKVLYRIIKENGRLKGARFPNRMAEDADINWLINKGKIIK